MSIEVRKKQEDKKSSSFGMKVAMPNLRNKGSAIKIQANTNMEKKKEDKMEKKEEKKFFYELLAETWQKGILSRGHTAEYDADGPGCYYCPICCVCEYLGLIPKIRAGSEKKHRLDHGTMVSMLREKCTFIDRHVTLDVSDGVAHDFGHGWSVMREENEPMLAFTTAASFHSVINNFKIAQMLKEQLYDGKKPMLEREKEEPLPHWHISGRDFPTIDFKIQGADIITEQLGRLSGSIKDLSLEISPSGRIKRVAYVRNEQTGNIELREFDG